MQYKVSVITPTYNRPKLIKETIKSFIEQDYENKEMIIVNDGSTKKYDIDNMIMGNNIKVINKENGGTASALNAGIMACTGDLICEIQDDDLLFDSKSLSSRVKVFQDTERFNIEVIWTSCQYIKEHGELSKVVHATPVNAWYGWKRDEINTNTLMWRKSIHEKIGYFPDEILAGEDQPFQIKMLMECSCLSVPDLITIKYREWGGSKGIPERTNGMKDKYTALMYSILLQRYNFSKFKNIESLKINKNITHEGDRMQTEFKCIEQYLKCEVNGQKRFKNGIDVGCGTNRLNLNIVSVDQQPDPRYAHAQLVHNCKDLNIFADNTLDFIFSSHCLEDFENIHDVFTNWWSKLKANGLMLLLLPDMEKCDCEHCKGSTRYPIVGADNGNPSHRSNVGKKFINDMLVTLKERGILNYEIIQEDTLKHNETSSIDFVIKKL